MKKLLLALAVMLLSIGAVAQEPDVTIKRFGYPNFYGQNFDIHKIYRNRVWFWWMYYPYHTVYGTMTDAIMMVSPALTRIPSTNWGIPAPVGFNNPMYLWVTPAWSYRIDPQVSYMGMEAWLLDIPQTAPWRVDLNFQIMFIYSNAGIGLSRCIQLSYQ